LLFINLEDRFGIISGNRPPEARLPTETSVTSGAFL